MACPDVVKRRVGAVHHARYECLRAQASVVECSAGRTLPVPDVRECPEDSLKPPGPLLAVELNVVYRRLLARIGVWLLLNFHAVRLVRKDVHVLSYIELSDTVRLDQDSRFHPRGVYPWFVRVHHGIGAGVCSIAGKGLKVPGGLDAAKGDQSMHPHWGSTLFSIPLRLVLKLLEGLDQELFISLPDFVWASRLFAPSRVLGRAPGADFRKIVRSRSFVQSI